HRREIGVALELLTLAARHVDRSAAGLGEIGDAAEGVEVPVRDQNRRATRLQALELGAQLRRVAAGIDDRSLRRFVACPYDVAVCSEQAQLVSVHSKVHAGECNGAPKRARVASCSTGSSTRSRR